jgi:HAD superfamily hydrolase (TIGR01509 family)
MDGTLVDSLGFWEALWKSLGEKYLGDPTFIPDPVTQKGVRTSTLYDAMSLVHQNCGIASSTDELFQYVEDMLFRYYRDTVCLKSGVREFLEYLKKRGVKMCVATATAPNLVDVLMKKFGLDEFFPKVISCNDVGKGKEHPDVFIKANEYLGTPKEQTWIFEDSCVALETAAKEGYSTVGIFDKHNFGAEEVENICTVFIGENDSLRLLIK